MTSKNIFGGGNAQSLYVPMSEVEQEAIARLIESDDLRVNLLGWGFVNNPRVTFGDARIQIQFRASFDRPAVPIPVYELELELVTKSGKLLFRDKQSVAYNGKPIQIAAGVYFDMVWDIMVRSIDPKLVKELVPGATGLTSRLQDKDTGDMTLEGNMKLDVKARKLLRALRGQENALRRSRK